MTILIIVLAILCILLLTPVSLVAYFDGKIRLEVKVLFFRYTIPLSKSKPKKEKTVQTRKKVKTDNKKMLSGFSDIKDLIPILFKRAFASLTVKKLGLDITVATDDPCNTALTYGAVNAAVYPLISLAEKYTKIKKKNINIIADYSGENTTVTFEAVVSTYLLRLIICLIRLVSDGLLKFFM